MGYQVLNIFFFVFHSLIVLFNVTGWIFKPTRKWNLILLLLTGASWFILGIWYGWGYCVCTDWHWDVRKKLGYVEESHNYIHFLILKLTGIDLPGKLVANGVMIIFVLCLALSIGLNWRDYVRRRKEKRTR
jgi:hypothetical protein